MSKLLIAEPPLQVLPSLAKEIGLSEAIVLQQLHYLSQRSKDGWVEKTLKEWQREHFIFWHAGTVKRAFTSLRNRELVLHEQPGGPDRTARYRVDYDALEQLIPSDQDVPFEGNNLRSSKSADEDLAGDESAPLRNREERTTDPPQPPKGNRQRDRDQFNNDLRAWTSSLLPEADPDVALKAVDQALRAGAHTRAAVLEHLDRWFPELLGGSAR